MDDPDGNLPAPRVPHAEVSETPSAPAGPDAIKTDAGPPSDAAAPSGSQGHDIMDAESREARPPLPPTEVSQGENVDDNASVGAPSLFSTGLSVDDDSSDADSSLGDMERPSSSVSVSSSVFQFVEEYGRTFHRYKEGKYFLPNDIPEQERLDLQHSIALRLFGRLALAPVANPPRVLDLGTGTGIWCIEFANANPASEVLGTDLSPIQPAYVPPNCRFEIDDADDEWLFSHPFDYVHSRFMIGAFGDFARIMAAAHANLVPGGWAEFQDYYAELQCADGSLAGTALERWNRLFLEGVERVGRSGRSAARFKSQMVAAGFTDVVERKFALPGNPWAKGEREKMLGLMQMTNILEGIHGMTINLFTKALGWSVEEVEVFLVDVRKDLKDTKIHFYYIVLAVYGRKPLSMPETRSRE